ncbi:MAG: hypothetical protein IKD96_07450 [Oscillospiraceae bacterium]|nr:hypothetical protein [Oscillospiraceae bacterium]
MTKRYAIWDKESPVITPVGEVLTASDWISRYPAAGLPTITVVCSAGEVNGGFFGTLGQMVQMYGAMGADFSGAETDEEKLEVIEAWEDAQNAPPAEATAADVTAVSLASIAASLEYQNMMTLPDVEEE